MPPLYEIKTIKAESAFVTDLRSLIVMKVVKVHDKNKRMLKISVADLHHFYAALAPAPGQNFDTAP
jgi:hypothetical protein